MDRYRTRMVAFAQLSVGLLAAVPTHAAATKVNQNDWWGGVTGFPSYVNMYIYVPKTLATKPPIVVVPHHCGGDASSSYSENSGLVTKADSVGFILVYPEATGQNCWDAGSPRSMNHSGTGDVPAIAQMVKYALAKYNGDAGRVYSVGGSSGGIVTEALLGVFPDVFAAGISIMGVPCGCWAEGYNDVTGKPSNGTGQWSGPCANGEVSKSGKAWGDLVRSYFPGYTGHRPRLQHWHGTSDTTLSYKNVAEDVKEWTNLLGLSETPTGSDSPKSGTTRQYWKNACGYTVYETFSLSGVGHSVSVDAAAIATYFGLEDKATTEDPESKACGSAGNGGGGTGNAGGTASVGASGAPAIAGRSNGQAGRGGLSLGGASSIAGGPGTGGRDRSGGGGASTLSGGTASSARATATGGSEPRSATGSGGSASLGNSAAVGGRMNTSAASNPNGGVTEGNNASSLGGSGTQTATATSRGGGMASIGGSTVKASDSSIAAATAGGTQNPESGCSCLVARSNSGSVFSGISVLLALCGMALRRMARRTSRAPHV